MSDYSVNYFNFIKRNLDVDTSKLRLATHGKAFDFDVNDAIIQIDCRRKAKSKLDEYLKLEKFVFPDELSSEQASHQAVAAYHSELIGKDKNVIDMSAGLGIDSLSFAMHGNKVFAIELNEKKCEALKHNIGELRIENRVNVIHSDSIKWLTSTDVVADVIYVDPARRTDSNARIYNLIDTQPNVVANMNLLRDHARRIIIKASPMLDLSQTIKDLPYLTDIHIVCVKGECKEVLVDINSRDNEEIQQSEKRKIIVVDLKSKVTNLESGIYRSQVISQMIIPVTKLGNDSVGICDNTTIMEGGYIYDLNAGMHKIMCGNILSEKFNRIKRLGEFTDLYYSDDYYDKFPGRIFKVVKFIKNSDAKRLKGERFDVITRNYTLNSEQLRSKLRVVSSNERFIIGCRIGINDEPTLIQCERVV